jgi:hypothetical protein
MARILLGSADNESPAIEKDLVPPGANGFSIRIPVNIAPSHQE